MLRPGTADAAGRPDHAGPCPVLPRSAAIYRCSPVGGVPPAACHWRRSTRGRRYVGARMRPAPGQPSVTATASSFVTRRRGPTDPSYSARSDRPAGTCSAAAPALLEGDPLEHVRDRLARIHGRLERLEDVLPADH